MCRQSRDFQGISEDAQFMDEATIGAAVIEDHSTVKNRSMQSSSLSAVIKCVAIHFKI